MILKTHGRYRYSPITDRPHYEWPGGKRLAVYVAINVEHFHFGEGLGYTPVVGQPFRLAQLRRALQNIWTHDDSAHVWFTRPGEIADHVVSLPRGVVPGSDTEALVSPTNP